MKRKLSVQINYLDAIGVTCTSCPEPEQCFDRLAELHKTGMTIGSMALYDYSKRKSIKPVAIMYANPENPSYHAYPVKAQ